MKSIGFVLSLVVLAAGGLCQSSPAAEAPAAPQVKSISRGELNAFLAKQQGKVVLVNFWATWCPPCRVELPLLVELQQKHAARGLVIVGLSLDRLENGRDDIAGVQNFCQTNKITYPVFIASPEIVASPRWEGASTLPSSFIFDKKGKLAARVGEKELERIAAKLEKELSSTSSQETVMRAFQKELRAELAQAVEPLLK